MDNQEKELYRMMVKYKNVNTQLRLMDKSILLEQEKGLFKKKWKNVETILLDNIDMENDKVKINLDNKIVKIYVSNKEIAFMCDNVVDAKKIMDKIISTKTGETTLDRLGDKTKKIVENTTKVVVSIGTLAGVVIKNRKKIAKAAKTVIGIFKK